ncbi:MAG: hypothetical protein ACLFUJ_11435 [Phycisphaerae bacterium]
MKFIKEYMFETILVVVTLVLAVGIWLQSASAGDKVQAGLEEREQVAQRLARLRRNGVSLDEFEKRNAWKERLDRQGELVAERALQFNDNYTILEVSDLDGTAKAPLFPWFPYSQGQENFGREGRAKTVLTQAFAGLIDSINATSPPDQEKMQTEYQRRYQKYRMEQERLRRKLGEEAENIEGGPGGFDGRMRDFDGPMTAPINSGQPQDPDQPQLLSDQQIQAMARADAIKRYVLESARSGVIYVDSDALAETKTPQLAPALGRWATENRTAGPQINDSAATGTEAQVAELWRQHVKYWVCSDIIDAIQQTNNLVFNQPGERSLKPSVPNAAIKRLVWIDCDGRFFLGQPDAESRDGMYSEYDDYDEGGIPRTRNRAATGQAAALPPAKNLTREVSSQKVDIVHYTVYMIMDADYLGAFQRHLAKKNYHTTLSVEFEEVRDPLATAPFHYYGAKPAVLVRLTGQLRLLADLTRGKPKEDLPSQPGQANVRGSDQPEVNPLDWFVEDYPPLVPVGILKQPSYAPALREIDRRRLPAESTTGRRTDGPN